MNPETNAVSRPRQQGFLANVVWNSLGAISTVAAGLLLQPYIVRKLGPARYGIWALIFSTLDYLRLFDFGFRASVVNYAARFRARGDEAALNRLLSTACVFYGGLALAISIVTVGFSSRFPDIFKVPEEYRNDAAGLAWIVGLSVALGMFASVFTGTLEAFQRFDLVNRAYIVSLTARMVGSVVLLSMGYGLVELGLLSLVCQIAERISNIHSVFRVVPSLRLRFSEARVSTFRELTGYSFSSFLISNAIMISGQSPMVMIGYLSSAVNVGYFSLPFRLVWYVGDIIPRIGTVTASKVAELDEHGKSSSMMNLTSTINRYCYALFLPFAIFMLIYGKPLLQRLVGLEFAARSAPVIPAVAILTAFTTAGMFNTVAAIIGQARHRIYAYGATVEIVAYFAALAWSIPRYGLAGAAWSGLAVLGISRGLFPAWLFCRQNQAPLGTFLAHIYLLPTLLAVPVGLSAWWISSSLLPGSTWAELILAGCGISLAYLCLALPLVPQPAHRRQLFQRISSLLGRPVASGQG